MKRTVFFLILCLAVYPAVLLAQCIPPSVYTTNRRCIPDDPSSPRLAYLNYALNESTHVISVRKTQTGGTVKYIASAGSKTPLYEGDDYAKLVQNVGPYHVKKDVIYYDLSGFSENDELTFKTTLELRNNEAQLTTWRREIFNEDMQNVYLGKMGNVEKVNISPAVNYGTAKNRFQVIVDFLVNKKKYFIECFSSSQKAVIDFAGGLKNKLINKSPSVITSLADVVATVKKDIREKYALDRNDLLVRFRTEEFTQTLIVDEQSKIPNKPLKLCVCYLYAIVPRCISGKQGQS